MGQKIEHLAIIQRRYNLVRDNFKESSKLKALAKVLLPDSEKPILYKMKRKESLMDIAKANDIPLNDLLAFNNIDPDKGLPPLREGRILGWCAPALQAAGKIFEKSEDGSRRAEQLARTEWLSHKEDVKWDTLTEIGNKVVQHQRVGEIVTLSRLAEIAGEDRAARVIKNSVEATIKDPEYQNRLEHLNAPTVTAPVPRGPSMKAAPRMAAAPAYSGPAAPGLGSSGSAKRPVSQPVRDPSEGTDERCRA